HSDILVRQRTTQARGRHRIRPEYPDEQSSTTTACGNDIFNPCTGGTCIKRGTEDWTCVCRPNHRANGGVC
ncbi:unnamed protein product, partial [Closterium sp. NIES-54]